MTVSANSPFSTPVPSMSKDGFIIVLQEAKSPYAGQGAQLYDKARSMNEDPARWLAISKHEHQHGTDPNSVFVRSHTNSLTNARSVRDPALKATAVLIKDPVRNSEYVKYANIVDSLQDGIYRIHDPSYAYANAHSIKEVISVWAPADDANNPASYTQNVVDSINAWAQRFPYTGDTPSMPTSGNGPDDTRFLWRPDQTEFGYGTGVQHGRSGRPIELLILHITAGTDSLDWLVNNNQSSAHYLTNKDGSPRAQMVLEADAAWTAGNREYNERGINVEVEMLKTSDWTDAIMRETARTIAPIMQRHGIPAVYLGRGDTSQGHKGMIGHRDVPDGSGGWGGSTHHDDPGANFDWQKMTQFVNEALNGPAPAPVPTNPNRYFPETQHYLGGGFRGFWETNGNLPIFGYPVSEEFRGDDNIVRQWFERARFEWQPNIAQNPYGVVLGLIGNESRDADAQKHPEAFAPAPAPAP